MNAQKNAQLKTAHSSNGNPMVIKPAPNSFAHKKQSQEKQQQNTKKTIPETPEEKLNIAVKRGPLGSVLWRQNRRDFYRK